MERKRDGRTSNTLCGALKKSPTALSRDGHLNLVSKEISCIATTWSRVPEQVAVAVTKLYLSSNFLTSLAYIDLFQNLKTASLMNNDIRYLEELQPLSRLPALEVLSLEGNIVSKMPYYRDHVITLCKALKKLDDQAVTRAERAATTACFHKIVAFYDKLRENELRNAVLIHISKVMDCHLELRREIVGRFRHLLSAHIGEPTARRSEGAGVILHQALQGGVFCRLQRMDCAHFSRLVQNCLYKLLVAQQQRGGAALPETSTGAQRALAIAGTVASSGVGQGGGASLWEGLVSAYLQEQYEFFLELSRYCELLLRSATSGRAGAEAGPEELRAAAADQDLIGHCIERVHFLAPVPSLPQDWCCKDLLYLSRSPHCHYVSASSAVSGRNQQRPPMVSVINVLAPQKRLQATVGEPSEPGVAHSIKGGKISPNFYGKENQAELPPPPPPPLPAVSRGPESAATFPIAPATQLHREGVLRQSHTDMASAWAEQRQQGAVGREQVQERYAQLLEDAQQSRRGQPPAPSAAPLSRNLPPQQREPDMQHRIATAGPSSPAALPPRRTLEQHTPDSLGAADDHSRTESPHEGVDRRDVWLEVDAFLARALAAGEHSAAAADGLPLEWEQQSHEAETRFLLAAQEVADHLSAGEEAEQLAALRASHAKYTALKPLKLNVDAAAAAQSGAGQNIHGLHVHIKALSERYTLCTVEEVAQYKLHVSLLATASSLQREAASIAETAAAKLAAQSKEVAAVRKDSRAGAVHVQVLQSDLSQVQRVQEDIAELRRLAQDLQAEEQRLGAEMATSQRTHAELQADIMRASASLERVTNEVKHDPAIRSVARQDRLLQLVGEFYTRSLARRRLLAYTLHRLRARTRRQQRIRRFCARRGERWSRALKRRVFAAWAAVHHTAALGKRLLRWRGRVLKARALDSWLRAYTHQMHVLPRVKAVVERGALRRAFEAFVRSTTDSRRSLVLDKKHVLYVSLFQSIRVFRAWKRLAAEGKQATAAALRVASRRRLQQHLVAWAAVAQQSREESETRASAVSAMDAWSRCGAVLARWRATFSYRVGLSLYRGKRRYFLRFLRRLVVQSQQRARLQALPATLLHAARRCLGRWRRAAGARRTLRGKARRIQQVAGARLLSAVWGTWLSSSQRNGQLYQAANALRRRQERAVQRQYLSRWWRSAGPSSLHRAQQTAGAVRERWLHLFDEPPSQPNIRGSQAVETSFGNATATDLRSSMEERGAVSAAERSRRKVQGRLLAMTAVDLQMLYWESDSDGDGDDGGGNNSGDDAAGDAGGADEPRQTEGITTDAHCSAAAQRVVASRYLARWRRRAARLQGLRGRCSAVSCMAALGTARRCFAAMLAAWTQRMTGRLQSYSAGLQDSAEGDETERQAALRADLGARQQAYADLRQLSDQLSLALAEARQTGAQHQAVLDDLASSAAALSAERRQAEQRAEQARRYCHAVRDKLQQAGQQEEEDRSQPSRSVADLLSLPSAAQLSFAEASSDAGSSALDVVSPESSEERLLLMRDVEALYAEATAAQERLVRGRQHLANQRAAAEALLAQRARQAAQLDADIDALRAQRSAVESALDGCNATLRASYSNVQDQVSFHERALGELDTSQDFLQDRFGELLREEARLEEHLQRLHARAAPAGSGAGGSGAFSSQGLGRSAALSADLLLSLRAATGGARQSSESATAGADSHPRDHRAEVPRGVRRAQPPQILPPPAATASDAAPPRPKSKAQKTARVSGIAATVPSAAAAAAPAGQRLPRNSGAPTAATAHQGKVEGEGRGAPTDDQDSIERQIDELSARIRRRLDAN